MTKINSLEYKDKEHEINDFYRNILRKLIIDKKTVIPLTSIDLDEYIDLFSFFMKNNNEAYKYNLPYLRYQHNRFRSFILSASNKYELFKSIMQQIINANSIQKFSKLNPQKLGEVIISLNDFLVSDLKGIIDFHEKLSILGAERNYNVLTIQYIDNGAKKIRQCNNFMKKDNNEIDTEKIIVLLEKVIGIQKTNTGGVF